MVCKTMMPIKLADARLLRIFKISNTFFDRFLSHPQLHEANLTGATPKKGGRGRQHRSKCRTSFYASQSSKT